MVVGLVHAEEASGITYREREKLTSLRRRYRGRHIQGVVVASFSRLSRSSAHLVILLQEMALHNVEFHCIQEYPDDSLLNDFILFMVQALTDIEREKALDTLLREPA